MYNWIKYLAVYFYAGFEVLYSILMALSVSGSQFHGVRSLFEHVLCDIYNFFNMIWIEFIFPVIGYPTKILDVLWIEIEPTFSTECVHIW